MQIGPKFAAAFIKAQGEIEGAKKGKTNPGFRSKYADLGACWDACRDALQAHGIGVIQLPCVAPAGYVGLSTTLLHTSGEGVTEAFHMPLKNPTDPQAGGSALTYARRYALCAAIGICPVDDDGNAAAAVVVPAKTTASKSTAPAVFKDWVEEMKRAKTLEEKKTLFFQLKNSAETEPTKSSLLTQWGKDIKAMQGENNATQS